MLIINYAENLMAIQRRAASFKQSTGFTLVELLLAVFILSTSIVGILLLFSQSMLSTEYAWDKTVATSHAENILEEMQLKESLSEITNGDWNNWVRAQGLDTLPGESIDVLFANPAADPLDIQVTVNWVRKKRNAQVILRTKMTK